MELTNMYGMDFFKSIEKAYEVIKDRKGETISGCFIKESDLIGGYK